jgi:hypothetical protein
MKFEIKELKDGGYWLWEKSDQYNHLIRLGDICLYKENKKNDSCCLQGERYFNYHGIKKALCGKTYWDGGNFSPKRILIIQMTK